MIITVTPSPSIDWTVHVDSFELDAVNRVTHKTREASGKGINVSVALHRTQTPTLAVFPAGKQTGLFVVEELTAQGVPLMAIESHRNVRTNITLIAPPQSGTKINEPGEELPAEVVESILTTCESALRQTLGSPHSGSVMLAICGSLPPGTPQSFHRELIEMGHRFGVPVVVDASGEVLHGAIPCGPDLIKPNVHELAEEAGHDVITLGDVVSAAQSIRRRGVAAVLASLGADGMMLTDAAGSLYGVAKDVSVVNTVGAGDAALAGYLAGTAHGKNRSDCLRSSLLYASSAVGQNTTLFDVQLELSDRIIISESFDCTRPLTEPASTSA